MAVLEEQPTGTSPRVAEYRTCTHGERSDAIGQVAALVCAALAELMDLLVAADAEGDYHADGMRSMVQALMAQAHLGQGTARDLVRVGKSLQRLPALREAFASGQLSFDQIRPAVTMATPETDERLAAELPGLSAAAVENRAKHHRRLTKEDARDRKRLTYLRRRRDDEAGGWRYSAFVPDTEAGGLNAALDRGADQIGPDPVTGQWAPSDQRLGRALADLGHRALTADPGPERTMVVIHIDHDILTGLKAGSAVVDGVPMPVVSVLRQLCDTKVEFAIHNHHGATVGIGRLRRDPPPWARRQVLHRDQTCRFPGCERPIRHLHHLDWWTRDHGRTDVNRLIGVCWDNHHDLHEGGWTVQGSADAELVFTSPYGHTLTTRPPALRDEIRQHISGSIGLQLGNDPDEARPDPAADEGADADEHDGQPTHTHRRPPANDPPTRPVTDTRHGPAP